MILSLIIARKKYKPQKFLFVLVIVFGLILFSYKDKFNAKDLKQIRGTALIAVSLLMDGMMGALQDRMRSVSKPTSLNLMFFLNAWSALYLTILLIITGEGVDFVSFCIRHPQVLLHLAILVSVGSLGQFFISTMISNFGALPLSLVMTIRKFLTVFLSVLIYKNELSLQQWIAASIIFIALISDSLYQLQTSPPSSPSSIDSSITEKTMESQTEISDEQQHDKKNLNLSGVIIDREFNETVVAGKQIEQICDSENEHKCVQCELCSRKI